MDPDDGRIIDSALDLRYQDAIHFARTFLKINRVGPRNHRMTRSPMCTRVPDRMSRLLAERRAMARVSFHGLAETGTMTIAGHTCRHTRASGKAGSDGLFRLYRWSEISEPTELTV